MIETILQKIEDRIPGKSMGELREESRQLEIEGYEADIRKYNTLIGILDMQAEATDEYDTRIVLEWLSDLMEYEREYTRKQLAYAKGEVGIEALEAENWPIEELTSLDERFEEYERQAHETS